MFDLNGVHTQYDDAVSILDPQIVNYADEVKMQTFEGVIWNRLSGPPIPISLERFKIGARTRTDLSGAIGDGATTGWDDTSTSDLPISSTLEKAVVVGSVLELDNAGSIEVVVVKAISRTANPTIDVYERGAGGTTAQAWADEVEAKITGHTINDVDAENVESRHEKTYKYENYLSSIFEAIDITETDIEDPREFFQNQGRVEYNEALDRVFQQLAFQVVRGVKVEGTKSKPPQSAGILSQLADDAGGTRDTLRYNVNGTFTEAKFKAALDVIIQRGSPNAIYCSYANKKLIDAFDNAVAVSSTSIADAKIRGEKSATHYEYQGVILEIVVDKAMPDSRVEIVNEMKIHRGWKTKRPLRFVVEPGKSSLVHRFSLQGKVGFVVRDVGTEHIDLYGIS